MKEFKHRTNCENSKADGDAVDADINSAIKLIRAEKANSTEPWLAHNGKPLSGSVLKQRSENWSLETWQRYGEYLDQLAIDPIEMRTSDRNLEKEFAGQSYEIHDKLERPKPDYSALHAAINSLDPIRRAVIKLVFFENLSVREAARKLKCPKSKVQYLKSTALSTLYEKSLDTFTYIGGKCIAPAPKERRKKAS